MEERGGEEDMIMTMIVIASCDCDVTVIVVSDVMFMCFLFLSRSCLATM